jgi:hypothetical protein
MLRTALFVAIPSSATLGVVTVVSQDPLTYPVIALIIVAGGIFGARAKRVFG